MKKSLTGAVVAYKKTGEGWHELFKQICLLVYKFPRLWTSLDEDRCSEFFLSFHPRISRLVKRFEPTHRFETYLFNSLRWFMKAFTENMANLEHYETWCVEESQEKMDTPEFGKEEEGDLDIRPLKESALELDETGILKNDTLRRRILYSVLLRAADFSDHDVPQIAKLIGVDADWLVERTHEARSRIETKVKLRENLREKRNEYWYQLSRARKRLADAVHDSEQLDRWRKKVDLLENRHKRTCGSIRKMNITLSHKNIGEIINVPPGTVSSGLHFLRRHLAGR